MRIGEKRSVSVPIRLDALGKTLGQSPWINVGLDALLKSTAVDEGAGEH